MDRIRRFQKPSIWVYCSYLFDWVFCAVLLVLFFLLDRAQPFHREFSVENASIMFPYESKQTIPNWALVLIAVIFPVVVIVVIGYGVRRSLYDVHSGILGLLVAILMTTMFTQALKVTVGKLRPDFLSRCIPAVDGVPIVEDIPLHLWTVDICSQTNSYILNDGFRSFPSGHTSTAFAGLTYLSLWVAGKMHVFDQRGYSLKSVILIVPILAAALVGVSRIQDYRHSAIDVTWGAIIGIIFAVYAYFQYYPSLFLPRSQVPYPPRDFSYMITDFQNSTEQADHLEGGIRIGSNDDFVDESTPTPGVLVGEEVRV